MQDEGGEDQPEDETEDLLSHIDSLNSRVLRETSLWNLHTQTEQSHACENHIKEINHNDEESPCTLQRT